MNKNLRFGCLYLTLVLVGAWADDLMRGTFVTASPTGNPVFGQEVYPIGRRNLAEMQNTFAKLQLPAPALETNDVELTPFELDLTPLDETTPLVVRSSDLCYRLTSLRC